MDQEMRKAFSAAELERATEQSIAATAGNSNSNSNPKKKCYHKSILI